MNMGLLPDGKGRGHDITQEAIEAGCTIYGILRKVSVIFLLHLNFFFNLMFFFS